MKRMYLLIVLVLIASLFQPLIVRAQSDNQVEGASQLEIYSIYDDNFQLLFQKDLVEIGDGYMSKDFKYYEVVYIDKDNMTGIAKFVRHANRPNVDISHFPKPISIKDRRICLYMTHNDESYVPSDGVDSVYGNGGIKDVALALKKELENNFIDVYFDDTLHIPHDYNAYTRSKTTANNLYNEYKPDAIFDIHRDATSRRFYVADVNGKERGRVRIVLGKSNPYLAVNEEFAMYIVAVASELYPWLITDIYYGGGHYNQSISGKALLFEMGTYLIEKELMIDSMKELSDVITTALYNTTVNENSGELTINGVEDKENVVVNDLIEEKSKKSISVVAICVVIVIMASISLSSIYVFVSNIKKQKQILTENKNLKDK